MEKPQSQASPAPGLYSVHTDCSQSIHFRRRLREEVGAHGLEDLENLNQNRLCVNAVLLDDHDMTPPLLPILCLNYVTIQKLQFPQYPVEFILKIRNTTRTLNSLDQHTREKEEKKNPDYICAPRKKPAFPICTAKRKNKTVL